ncbi:MAG TPA: hypothetical protein DCP92_05520 [Nitrospiraceae bacterium]|nr:hypothetical protein [Nitrospiraceae bacterium]
MKCAIEITDENALRSQDHKKKQYPDLSCELSARGETMSYFIEADMGSEDPEELFNKVKGHEKLTMILCQKIDRIKKIVNTFDRLIRELDEKEREQQSSKMLFKLHSDFIRHGLWDKWIKLRSSATPLRNFRDVILEEVYLEEVLDLPILAPLYGNRGEGSI